MSNFSSKAARVARAMTWSMLVSVALAGAALVIMSPDGQQRIAQFVSPPEPLLDEAFSLGTAAGLEQRVAAIETSLKRLHGKTIESADRLKDLDIAVAGLKEQFGQVTGSIAPDPGMTVLERTVTAASGRSAGSVDVRVVPLSPAGISAADRANDVAEVPLTTPMVNLAIDPNQPATAGSVLPPPIPVPTITVTDFGIELARAATIDELEREWTRLSGKQKKALASLEPRISLDFSSGGTAKLVLLAGPIRNAGDAARLCAMLAAAGEMCHTVPFGEDTVALNAQR